MPCSASREWRARAAGKSLGRLPTLMSTRLFYAVRFEWKPELEIHVTAGQAFSPPQANGYATRPQTKMARLISRSVCPPSRRRRSIGTRSNHPPGGNDDTTIQTAGSFGPSRRRLARLWRNTGEVFSRRGRNLLGHSDSWRTGPFFFARQKD